MTAIVSSPLRFLLAALAAGLWVLVSGLVMAATFGYRDMKAAFDAIGLDFPQGMEPFIVHTLVRLVMGAAVVTMFVIMTHVFPPGRALLISAGLAWLLTIVLPWVVMAEWGFFPWSLVVKALAWSAGELLIAGLIGWWIVGGAPGSG